MNGVIELSRNAFSGVSKEPWEMPLKHAGMQYVSKFPMSGVPVLSHGKTWATQDLTLNFHCLAKALQERGTQADLGPVTFATEVLET